MTFVSNEERMQRESNLIATIREKLASRIRKSLCRRNRISVLHQDAFAADTPARYVVAGAAR